MVGQETRDKNADILTVNIAVLPSLSNTTPLSSSPIYSESSTHPSSKSINFMPAVIIHEKHIAYALENKYFFN